MDASLNILPLAPHPGSLPYSRLPGLGSSSRVILEEQDLDVKWHQVHTLPPAPELSSSCPVWRPGAFCRPLVGLWSAAQKVWVLEI